MLSAVRPWRSVAVAALLLAALGWVLRGQTTAFGRPQSLVSLVCVSMVVLLLGYDAAWRQAARRRLIEPLMQQQMGEPSLAPRLVLRGLWLTAALVLLALSAARPKGRLAETTATSEGLDLIICLDVSGSMRVRDMDGRARLDVAKELVGKFIQSAAGDRLGLIAFAGSAHVMCPFTLDTDTLDMFLKDVDYHSVAKQGTMIGDALRLALDRFDPNADCGQVIVLLTDGEDQGSQPLVAAEAAGQRGVVIHAIGLGSNEGGTIPLGVDVYGNPINKRYLGQEVTSRLNPATLRGLAQATGGRWFLADTPKRLEEVLADISKMKTKILSTGRVEFRQDVFVWYLLPALLLLAIEPRTILRRRARRENRA